MNQVFAQLGSAMETDTLHVLIFSKNRAAQLHALLISLFEKVSMKHLSLKTTVLYDASTKEFESGYQHLASKEWPGNIRFVKEEVGRHQVDIRLFINPRNLYRYLRYPWLRRSLDLLSFKLQVEGILSETAADSVMFLTDDSLFYRPVTISKDVCALVNAEPSQHVFSLRMGRNIKNLPAHIRRLNEYCEWELYHPDCDKDWSYSFSVDGCIYSRSFLLAGIRKVLYVNPNSFEGFVWNWARRKRFFSVGYCFPTSALIGFELNRVQSVSPNNNLDLDPRKLNDLYLKGYVLEYDFDACPVEFHTPLRKLTMKNLDSGERVDLLRRN